MGIKVMTLVRKSLADQTVRIHSTNRRAKVFTEEQGGGLIFSIQYLDDPEKVRHPIHFDQQNQGFVTDTLEELDDDPEPPPSV